MRRHRIQAPTFGSCAIHILSLSRYTGQTHYANTAVGNLRLLIHDRCKLVRHLLKELLVLET